MPIKKNISLIVGVSIPILMILFVAGSIYLPGFFVKPPRFNFLYASGDEYPYGAHQYVVQGGTVIKNENNKPQNQNQYPREVPQAPSEKLLIHDVIKNESKEVSFEEAQSLSLDSNAVSPDGFEVVYGSNGGGMLPFFYSGSDYNSRYLKGHGVSRKLNTVMAGGSRYYNNFNFLGWIKK